MSHTTETHAVIANLIRNKPSIKDAVAVLAKEEEGMRISIEEMLEPETIERIGCGRDRELNVCLVRICGEVRELQEQIVKLKNIVS